VEHDEDPALGIALQLEEVVPRAERAELVDRPIEPGRLDRLRSLEPDLDQGGLAIDRLRLRAHAHRDAGSNLIEDGAELGRAQGVDRQVGLDQGDPAADVDADAVGHDRAVGEQHAADLHAVARVGVGHERDVMDRERQVRQVRGLLERRPLEVDRPALDRDTPGLAHPRQGCGHCGRRCRCLRGHGCRTSGRHCGCPLRR
jgi:hypothetical protein